MTYLYKVLSKMGIRKFIKRKSISAGLVAYLGYGRHGSCHERQFDGSAKITWQKSKSATCSFFNLHFAPVQRLTAQLHSGVTRGNNSRAPNHCRARRKNSTMSQVLSSTQCIFFRKTSSSNMGASNLLLFPGAQNSSSIFNRGLYGSVGGFAFLRGGLGVVK